MSEQTARPEVFMHPNGQSTERNIAEAIMQKLGLDWTDFRRRDEVIMAAVPAIEAERIAMQSELAALRTQLAEVTAERAGLREKVDAAIAKLKTIAEVDGQDAGVIYLSDYSPTHTEKINGRQITVYNHENFSELGDALVAMYGILTTTNQEGA